MKCELINNLAKDVKEIGHIQDGIIVSILKYDEYSPKLGQVFCDGEFFGLDSLSFGITIIDYYKVGDTKFKKTSYDLFLHLLKDESFYDKFFMNLKITFLEIASFMQKKDEEVLLLNLRKIHNRSSTIKGLPKDFVLNYIDINAINNLIEKKYIYEDDELYYYNPE
ncbi:hypothetical protein [Marinitoga litoralis]|jgi:hypothetical protein|uniref:hypothetical protein n=1 Tax=Marinitoga litoralis TaxID=570855 RepID=UPI0019600205|nr:hypothetical protein [Marinitoga litoralis]MBM7559464.1 hypothetical protein [Marinitoga litoralis]